MQMYLRWSHTRLGRALNPTVSLEKEWNLDTDTEEKSCADGGRDGGGAAPAQVCRGFLETQKKVW